MIAKIRRQFEEIRDNKLQHFDDLDGIVQRCFREYGYLFPRRQVTMKGSKVVYHANIEGLDPISLEKEHGSRDAIPRRFAKFAIAGIDGLITYIEGATSRSEEERHAEHGGDEPEDGKERDPK